MLKLLKYEIRKTLPLKLILLGITGLLEFLFLAGVMTRNDTWLSIGISLLTVVALFSLLLMGIQSLMTLHRDMNTRQSYMLFMTPNSSYSILGAKVLECGLSLILAGAFYMGLGMLDLFILAGRYGEVQQVIDLLQNFMRAMNMELQLNAGGVACCVILMISMWLNTVVTASLADVISSALLNGKRFNGLIAFIIFIVLNAIMSQFTRLIPAVNDSCLTMIIDSGVCLFFTVIMYIGTATIMDRHLSV